MKKSGRKLVGVLLAASMIMTAVFPMQGMAAEGNESGYEETEEKVLTEGAVAEVPDEGQQPEEEVIETEASGKEQEPAEEETRPEALDEEQQPEETEPEVLEEDQQPESEGQEAPGETLENGQADVAEPEKEEIQLEEGTQAIGEAEMNTFMLPQENGEENILPLVDKYDIDRPVIESFEFTENGQTLTVNDTLHFTMSVYDNDSGINSIYVYMGCSDSYISGRSINFEKSGEGNLYTSTLSCSELKGSNYYISEIRVTDMVGNYIDGKVYDDNYQYLYNFTLDQKVEVEDVNISVSNFQMQTNPSNGDGKLRVSDTVTYTADITSESEVIQSVDMCLYAYADNYSGAEWINMNYDASAKKVTGTYSVTDKTYPAEWELYYICVYTESGKYSYFYPQNIETDVDLKFTVVQDDYDTEKPIIEDISIDKNGQYVFAEDTVTIKVKVSEAHPSEYATAYFNPQVSYVSASKYVNLKLNADTMEYIGTIDITEETYPCEWALTDLYIYDEFGHTAYLYDFQNDWSMTYPWYYKVQSGDTYREDFKNVTFEFYGLVQQEDGSYQFGTSSEVAEKVGRRASLKDLNVSFPQPIEGVNTEWKYRWWYGEEGLTIDENTELLFNSTSYMTISMTAIYDKGCANVFLTYMSKNSGIKSVCIPIFVDKEATYKDVLNVLNLPEDAQTEEFAEFKLGDSYDENTPVGDISDFSVEAKYNNCQVAWNTRYIDKDGNETSKVINKSYLEGTNISDALADLEKPESANGMEFEAWVLTNPDENQTISQPMVNLDVVAVYRGKTTVDASYTYRGEDGTIASDSKLMLIDGESLSDAAIQGEATAVFKNVNHLNGLRLSEWTSAISLNQGRYKKVQFQALYYNCVVTLKFPDNTCQYIVVDKDASYILPTENDKYRDIVWDGYEKGATVIISKDTEFTVKEYKDNAQEETGGIKLSEEEIAKIIEEIKNAAEGETIIVDMKKATVIPKEVQEAIQGKSVNIVLNMEGYSWTINGTDVVATDLKDIDLEVKIDTDAIPSNLVASIAGGKPTTQISLTHNGEFGFRANLTLNLGSENSGSTGNLYYYDSSGKLVFINAGQIGADGTTSLPFSHASDYVIVIDNKSSDIEENDKDDENPKKGDDSKKDRDEKIDRNDEDDETANIEKNPDNTTTDSDASETDTTDSSKMKSPKTGE